MNSPSTTALHRIYDWAERHPGAHSVPSHIQAALDVIERHDKAAGKIQQDLFIDAAMREDITDEFNEKAYERARRRVSEFMLAYYVDDVAMLSGESRFHDVAERLRTCRVSGTLAITPGGEQVVMWDNKCGMVRLCPDESREETQRLTDFYLPEMMDFLKASPMHRIHYSVMTTHNYRPDDLRRGKQEQFDKFAQLKKQFPNIKGSLVIQEDPLSALKDWNVHLNVFFLTSGAFNYDEIRKAWGSNVHFQTLKGNESQIRSALLEAVKYSARTVPEKSQEKADYESRECAAGGDHKVSPGDRQTERAGTDKQNDPAGCGCDTQAPAMTEWPWQRFVEWYDAGLKFRRVRSYGVLYAAHGKRWDRMSKKQRVLTCVDAELSRDVIEQIKFLTWKQIYQGEPKKDREKLKAKLRHAMVYGEKIDYTQLQWVGIVGFNRATASYSVDLITGDNFSGRSREKYNYHMTGPPN